MRFTTDDGDSYDTTADPEIVEAVRAANAAAQDLAGATEASKQARSHLVKLIEARGDQAIYVEVDQVVYKVSVVHSSTAKADEEALRNALGLRRFRTISKTTVDNRLLNQAVLEGRISPDVLRHVQLVHRQPWPKVTQVEKRPPE